MSATSLTPEQLAQVEVAAKTPAYAANPALIWQLLASFGDQYAEAAYVGLTNQFSLYGQVIAYSNFVSGVSSQSKLADMQAVAQGYVAILETAADQPNPDGTISLPTTTQIELNYYNASIKVGVSPLNAIDLSMAEAFDNLDGSGSVTLYASGLTVTSASGGESITVGADTFALNPHSVETVTASGTTSDVFVHSPGFGQETITGFDATGASHDLLQFNASAFGSGLTAANQNADWQALLSDTANNSAGAAVITDIYGDSLTLTGVSKTTLSAAANAADFKFV